MAPKSIIRIAGVVLGVALILGCGESVTKSHAPVLTFLQSGCHDGSETWYRPAAAGLDPQIINTVQGGCQDSLAGTFSDSLNPGGTVRFEVAHDTVRVYHDSAFYNCCASIAFNVEQNGEFLDFIEADTSGESCYCLCHFDLQASAAGVPPGTYTVRLWTENRACLLGEAQITIPGSAAVWFETKCDTLLVYHNAKFANCGSIYLFDFTQEGSMLTFTEIDTSSMWMYCVCYFDLSAQATGLADGEYTVRLWDKGNSHGLGGAVDSLITQTTINISCP